VPDAVVPVLLGEGETQVVEEVEVELEPPALELEDPEFDVIVDRCEVIPGKVLVTGRVIVNVSYKTKKAELTTDGNGVRIFCGDVRHCTAIVPFSGFIEVPGVANGDECTVICVGVEGVVREGTDTNGDHLIDRLRLTFVVVVQVRVTRDLVVDIRGTIRTPLSQLFIFPRR
jgi:hypothetical protein